MEEKITVKEAKKQYKANNRRVTAAGVNGFVVLNDINKVIALARLSPIVFAVLLCDSAAIPTCRVHRLGSDVPRIICGHNKALILPGLGGVGGLYLIRQFFLGIPKDLIESARMDGLTVIFSSILELPMP